jgi:hypothetical protein
MEVIMEKIHCEQYGKHIANLVDGNFVEISNWGMSENEHELCAECCKKENQRKLEIEAAKIMEVITMKYYVQFLTTNAEETGLIELLGSEGVFVLDGRFNERSMRCAAQERMHKLRHLHSISGYRIMKGNKFSNGVCIYEWIRSGCLIQHRDRHELEGILNVK